MSEYEFVLDTEAARASGKVRIASSLDTGIYHECGEGPGETRCGMYVRTVIFRQTAERLGMRCCKRCGSVSPEGSVPRILAKRDLRPTP